jgi:hypothetical protein
MGDAFMLNVRSLNQFYKPNVLKMMIEHFCLILDRKNVKKFYKIFV